ncbi:MAG: hypothetical protein DDT18_01148 [Actinobacteria bacterium]|nr:hypothetical protein [Actinomycetota bacterium]
MTIKEIEKQLLEECKMLWTDWSPQDDNRMKRVGNKPVKDLLRQVIRKAYEAGFERADEIITIIRSKNIN